jgi:hypothetical protein
MVMLILATQFTLLLNSERKHLNLLSRNDESPTSNFQSKDGHIADLSINSTGVTQQFVKGDQSLCKEVIYTADTRLPSNSTTKTIVDASWDAFAYLSGRPIFNQTCFAFFHISSDVYDANDGPHPVWGRIPATSLVMTSFPQVEYMLYIDSDAMIASANYTPSSMYHILSFDGYGMGDDNVTMKYLSPSLIVNKPLTGWACGKCNTYGLGHGCFNSGALLWRRSEGMKLILNAWWDSRLNNRTQNFILDGQPLFGWTTLRTKDYTEKMSEQNRLMYIHSTNKDARDNIWSVPRQRSWRYGASCPGGVREYLTPCLQNDFQKEAQWNAIGASCFINHFAGPKDMMHKTLQLILDDSDYFYDIAKR